MSDKALAVQLLDEQLTAAGHDPECAAYEPGRPCSGPPVCNGDPLPELYRAGDGRPANVVGLADFVPNTAPAETLTGPAALKLRAYKSSVAALKIAEDAYKQVAADMRKALEEFTAAVMG